MTQTASCSSRSSGKERDSETGLDYFGARYHASTMGRWMSPDPSNLGVDFWVPQSWNRYSYSVNNPLSWVDKNGLWPTTIHNMIIDNAFPGLSASDRQVLKDASYATDYGTVDGRSSQDPAASYIHGMSDGTTGQDGANAEALGDSFIEKNLELAKTAQADWEAHGNAGLSPIALQAFGNAMHTVMDRTSPAHEGNQAWRGTKGAKNKLRAFDHVGRESYPYSKPIARAVQDLRQRFSQTFNQLLFAMARAKRVSCVTTPKPGGGTETTCEEY